MSGKSSSNKSVISTPDHTRAIGKPMYVNGFWVNPDSPIEKLAIGCMDDRLWQIFTELQKDGKVLAFRNGGGLVSELLGDIDQALLAFTSIKTISFYTHRDCGAMKIVQKDLTGQMQASADVRGRLVRHIGDRLEALGIDTKTISLEEVELFNATSKGAILRPLERKYPHLVVEPAKLVEVKDLAKRTAEHESALVLFTSPTNTMTPEEITKMVLGQDAANHRVYHVQRPSLLHALPDLGLAFLLGVRELRLVSLGEGQNEKVEGDLRMLEYMAARDKDKAFLKEMKISSVPYNGI